MLFGGVGTGSPGGEDWEGIAGFATNMVTVTMVDGAAALTAGAAFLGYLAM